MALTPAFQASSLHPFPTAFPQQPSAAEEALSRAFLNVIPGPALAVRCSISPPLHFANVAPCGLPRIALRGVAAYCTQALAPEPQLHPECCGDQSRSTHHGPLLPLLPTCPH